MSRYLLIMAYYIPHLGGVERYNEHLSAELVRRGHEVVILTTAQKGLPFEEEKDGVRIFRIPCFSMLGGRYPVPKPGRAFLKVHKKLMKEKFDFILINTRFYVHSLYGVVLGRLKKTPFAVLDHGTGHVEVGNPKKDQLISLVEHLITGIERRLCRRFYGVSRASCRWLRHFGIRARGVLYNAVDPKAIDRVKNDPVRDYKEEFKVPDGASVITYTGRLVKEKGVFSLIEAAKALKDQGRNIVCFIAGDGDEMEAVKKEAALHPFIIPLGRISFEEVISLLAQTDVFCFPTEYPEGFSTSVLEAIACGCYVITTKNGSAKEMLPDLSYGCVLPDGSSAKVEAALSNVLSMTAEERKEITDRAYGRLSDCFTWEKTADRLEKIAEKSRRR